MTPREVKQYDIRLDEILSEAQKLFTEFGYSKVSVQKIIDRVGIAKGTFYHYFKSKDELLDALVMRWAKGLIGELSSVVDNQTMNAIEKLNALMIQAVRTKLSGNHSDIMKVLTPIFMIPGNEHLADSIVKRSQSLAIPLYAKIIRDGVADGSFDLDFYDEAAEFLITLTRSLQGKFMALMSLETGTEIRAEYERMIHIFETAAERLLGAKRGTLSFTTPESLDLIETFIVQFKTMK